MAENSSWLKGGILNLLERITLLDRVTLVDTLTAITNPVTVAAGSANPTGGTIDEVTNVPSVDLVDRMTLLDAVVLVARITLLDRVTLIDTLTTITNPVGVQAPGGGAVPVDASGTTVPVSQTALRDSATTDNVTGAEAAPSGAEGVSCDGYTKCAILFADLHNQITSYDVEIWLNDGTNWAQARDANGAVVAWNGITSTFAMLLDVAGFTRVFARVDTITTAGGTTIDRSYNVSGPG